MNRMATAFAIVVGLTSTSPALAEPVIYYVTPNSSTGNAVLILTDGLPSGKVDVRVFAPTQDGDTLPKTEQGPPLSPPKEARRGRAQSRPAWPRWRRAHRRHTGTAVQLCASAL